MSTRLYTELQVALDGGMAALDEALERGPAALAPEEVGHVLSVGRGVVRLGGLPGVQSEELVRLEGGALGMAFNLDRDEVGVILLGEGDALEAGQHAHRTGHVLDVPVGEALLGRVVDALGRPLDEGGPLQTRERLPAERPAPPMVDRAPVSVPLQTGIKVIDALIPIGRGQRELILGDRQTGKTAIALDTMINQKDKGVVCVYCAIGQRQSAVARLVADLRAHGALGCCIVVVAAGEDAPGLQFVAPYAATAMAERLMEAGRDVLIVYDDLTRHARAYRELSLLLRRPPGREAYPGDIFYIHSRLLERATHLCAERGGGSLTALPIIETYGQDLSAYVPTNLISITDGQVYLSPTLFRRGVLPAVDVGKSVSRVGGKAQLPAYRAVAGDLRLAYSQFEELEIFARFDTQIGEETRREIERGRRVREALKQPEGEPIPVPEQIAVLLAATEGLFDELPEDAVERAEREVRRAVVQACPELCRGIECGAAFDAADRQALVEVARRALEGMEASGADA